jgi:hypothetical protein
MKQVRWSCMGDRSSCVGFGVVAAAPKPLTNQSVAARVNDIDSSISEGSLEHSSIVLPVS